MKNQIISIILIFTFFLFPGIASGEGISILKLNSEPVPFNDMRDPVNDSLYNAFDIDPESSALFSDFSIHFTSPVTIDELKIINGNTRKFKQYSRLRDIEITLYTIKVIEDKKKMKSVDNKFKSKQNKKDQKIKTDKSSEGKDNRIPVKDKKSDKEPVKDDKNKNTDEKNTSGVTACSGSNAMGPVTGILNNPLAEEPDKPVQVEVKEIHQDKSVNKKNDIRDSGKTPVKKNGTGQKITADKKKKKTALPDVKKPANKKQKVLNSAPKIKQNTSEKNLKKESSLKTETLPATKDIPFKKMEGVTKILNDSEGRVIINVSLKDINIEQSIKLGGEYSISAFEIRKRDDYNYSGSNSELPYLSSVSLLYKSKRAIFQALDPLKKEYVQRFVKALELSITDKVFSAFENDKEVTRVFFRKNGKIEIRDRFKCSKKGDTDCTSSSMPDMWMIRDGRLYLRYKNEWIPWKFELEYTPDIMNGAESESDSRQWFKLYYKNETGFSENYLYLEKKANQEWGLD